MDEVLNGGDVGFYVEGVGLTQGCRQIHEKGRVLRVCKNGWLVRTLGQKLCNTFSLFDICVLILFHFVPTV